MTCYGVLKQVGGKSSLVSPATEKTGKREKKQKKSLCGASYRVSWRYGVNEAFFFHKKRENGFLERVTWRPYRGGYPWQTNVGKKTIP